VLVLIAYPWLLFGIVQVLEVVLETTSFDPAPCRRISRVRTYTELCDTYDVRVCTPARAVAGMKFNKTWGIVVAAPLTVIAFMTSIKLPDPRNTKSRSSRTGNHDLGARFARLRCKPFRALHRNRTDDLLLTMEMLCRLS
jgi:hypothetical protein